MQWRDPDSGGPGRGPALKFREEEVHLEGEKSGADGVPERSRSPVEGMD